MADENVKKWHVEVLRLAGHAFTAAVNQAKCCKLRPKKWLQKLQLESQ